MGDKIPPSVSYCKEVVVLIKPTGQVQRHCGVLLPQQGRYFQGRIQQCVHGMGLRIQFLLVDVG